ncbi:low molecular weight phosphotyrosine protein phosphatase [Pseudoteredinibacter isoporae]|nr:low molecular weight phosphotyrosine protein phosphatase [Pseudoteredinibacter isoporae]NIB24200.1 low molecular weight phosphotyrosine protein phosphatase [Pseudoteredinibacter isoporae]
MKVLFVCLGNICRSPTADGVFQKKVKDAGLADQIIIDSAGTGGWHIGNPADPRASQHAAKRGYDMSQLRARKVADSDFEAFDYVLAMDADNLHDLQALCPDAYQDRVQLMLDYLPEDFPKPMTEVPDPYYGGEDGFELVLDLIEAASDNLLADIQQRLT